MAQCVIMKTFKGSQDGMRTEEFKEGEIVELSDHLMASAVPDDFHRLDQHDAPVVENKAVITFGSRKHGGRK